MCHAAAAWSGSAAAAAAALAVAGQGVLGREPKLSFWRGPGATLRKKPNAKEDDMKKESRSDQRCAMGKWIVELVGTK